MNKLELLQEELRNYGKVAIAYSGGVDSNFLFHVAIETLGKENVLPVLCRGAMMSKEDIEDALEQLKDSNHVVLSVNPLDVEAFHFNHKDRCYHCKRSIMSKVIAVAKEHDFAYVLDGKNKDDEKVYRPGLKACEELGIISPLANNNLTKQEIRDYVKGIDTALAELKNYDPEVAFKGEAVVPALKQYIEAVIETCGAITSNMLAFNDQLSDVQAAYLKKDEAAASTISKSAESTRSAYQRYTENGSSVQ